MLRSKFKNGLRTDCSNRSKEFSVHSFLTNLPIIRGYLHNSVPYHVGSVLGNRLGLQVVRTTSQYLQFKVRSRSVANDISKYVGEIEEDGIALIENFLEPSQFNKVKAEFESAFEGIELQPYKNGDHARLYRIQIALSELKHGVSTLSKYFQHNDRLNRIASAAVRRKISRPPDVHLDWYQSGDATATDNDIENIMHADLHTATVKMFFYLDDVNESNGAFIYAKGSHRLTLNRLRHEYDLSVRQAKLRKGVRLDDSLVEARGKECRNLINPKYREAMNVKETQICVKGNTLVVANNMGFHRRGEFPSSRPRKSIQINYRYVEEPFGKHFFSRNGR